MVFTMNMESPDAVRVVGVSGVTNGPVLNKIADAIATLSPRLNFNGLDDAMKQVNGGHALVSENVDMVKTPLAGIGKTTTDKTHSV